MPVSVAGKFRLVGRYIGQCSEVLIVPDKFTILCLSGLVPCWHTRSVYLPCLPSSWEIDSLKSVTELVLQYVSSPASVHLWYWGFNNSTVRDARHEPLFSLRLACLAWLMNNGSCFVTLTMTIHNHRLLINPINKTTSLLPFVQLGRHLQKTPKRVEKKHWQRRWKSSVHGM